MIRKNIYFPQTEEKKNFCKQALNDDQQGYLFIV